jgi:hypothetical protein
MIGQMTAALLGGALMQADKNQWKNHPQAAKNNSSY